MVRASFITRLMWQPVAVRHVSHRYAVAMERGSFKAQLETGDS